jgi:hypothetical protein
MPAFFGLSNGSTNNFEKNKLDEIYFLVTECGFSYSDVLLMTVNERRYFINKRAEINVREKQQQQRSSSAKKMRKIGI